MPAEGQDGLVWIYKELPKVVESLRKGYDRLRYGPLFFGYDGTWPASWSVQQVKDVLPFIRRVIGNCAYFGMMFGTGPSRNPYFFVEDEGDYYKPWMQSIDIIMMTEGPDQLQCPALINGMQYLLGPQLNYNTNGCKPDWRGPYLMYPGTPRGPYFAGIMEWETYNWVRGRVSADKVTADRNRARSIGVKLLG